MNNYDELIRKLREIFQIDRPELDFGIYRILNARAGEIQEYLGTRLRKRVGEILELSGNKEVAALRMRLHEKEELYRKDGIDPDTVTKIRELREEIAHYGSNAAAQENEVFTHLLTFFSRYYDKGDFISQRRYKGDTYAIPYSGEEVVLHWANKDQYYTKSGEYFSNYAFRLQDGRTVRFLLVKADTAKDNRKENDRERRFVLVEPEYRTYTDDEGEEYEALVTPIGEKDGELIIRFDYKPMPKGTKQAELVAAAAKKILDDPVVRNRWQELADPMPTEKNPLRTLLEKSLTAYTEKNLADYFIHKDLGRFLRRELDFYIKNEVMNLNDVQHADTFAGIEKSLRMIQTLREIALDLIAFLAQLEDFQKKLWLKKKFIVSAHYCVTLDRIPEELYPAIMINDKQWQQWQELGMIEAEERTSDFLKGHPFLMADTALYDPSFKEALLQSIDNLDKTTDGLLIHGDNFQALNLLQERYREQVKCTYIDPPYNTGGDGFAYKDSYQHSSWLASLHGSLQYSMYFQSDGSGYFISIDDNEAHNLRTLCESIFGQTNFVGNVIWWKKYTRSNDAKWFSDNHDHILVFSKEKTVFRLNLLPRSDEQNRAYSNPDNHPKGPWKSTPLHAKSGESGSFTYTFRNGRVWSPPPGTFPRFSVETLAGLDQNNEIWFGVDDTATPSRKSFLSEVKDGLTCTTIWHYEEVGHNHESISELKGLFPENPFPNPKPTRLLKRVQQLSTESNSVVLDYFAGSGTTGHAVISLNREDGGNRKYILVEQGEYFDTVLKPRIQKVVYSSEWKAGKAKKPETGISHAFKVLRIESYEDTLNNLELRRTEAQQDLLSSLPEKARNEYLMHYMLDLESRASLLSVEQFRRPFDCRLKVAVDSAGAFEERPIDLVETFNYLIGLRVHAIDIQREQGFALVTGTLPGGENTLVLWRDEERIDYDGLSKLCGKLKINPSDSEYDVVYLNGDHNIPSAFTTTEVEGGITRRLKLRQIEPEFLERMFNVEDV